MALKRRTLGALWQRDRQSDVQPPAPGGLFVLGTLDAAVIDSSICVSMFQWW
jgi:hypothetical protein